MAIYNITAEGEDGLEEHEVIEALMVLGLHDIAMSEDEEDDIEPHKGGGLKKTKRQEAIDAGIDVSNL